MVNRKIAYIKYGNVVFTLEIAINRVRYITLHFLLKQLSPSPINDKKYF